jgi:hypothetical protein
MLLLPSVRKFNDEQKFMTQMEILKVTRYVKNSQHLCDYPGGSLPPFPNTYSLPPYISHLAVNPLTPQPTT